MKKIELDLNNPIFVLYFNIKGMSMQKTQESLKQVKESVDVYSNITFWILPSDKTLIECVYTKSESSYLEVEDLITQINKRIEILSESETSDDFKINIRDWKIDNLIDG